MRHLRDCVWGSISPQDAVTQGGFLVDVSRRRYPTLVASPGGPTLFIPARLSVWLVWGEFGGLKMGCIFQMHSSLHHVLDKGRFRNEILSKGVDGSRRPDTAVAGCS